MSEPRALRDKLEAAQAELRRSKTHLDKLRAHQARERESLQQELEAARREVAELRTRLEGLEARKEEPAAAPTPTFPALVERGPPPPNTLVALVRSPQSLDKALPVLSRLLGLAPADLRLRLAAVPPSLLTRLPASEAEALLAALRSQGFVAVSCEVAPRAGGLMAVRRFTLEEQELRLEGTKGERQRVPYAELRLLVRGRQTFTTVEDRLDWALPETSALTMGGLRGGGRPAPALEVQPVRQDHHSQFLWAYGEGIRLSFSQGTQFNGLGARRGSALHENLQNLKEELRQRVPQVVVDERLQGMPRFSMPLVPVQRSHELFGELLFQAVRQGVWA